MRKFITCGALSTFLILISLPAWAQRGGGGHASMGSGISASSMGRGEFESREPDFPAVRTRSNTDTNMEVRSKTKLKKHGLENAEMKQSANTKADSRRDFTVAPGVEKAEGKHSSRMDASARSNATVKTHGLERAETSQSANAKADSKRDFTVSPGVEKAEAKQSSRLNAHPRSNASLKTRGRDRADASQDVNAGASTHTSFGGKIKHRLHL